MKNWKTLLASVSLIAFDKILMTADAVKQIEEMLA